MLMCRAWSPNWQTIFLPRACRLYWGMLATFVNSYCLLQASTASFSSPIFYCVLSITCNRALCYRFLIFKRDLMFLVDSHCHLDGLDYESLHKDVDDVLAKAAARDVKFCLAVATTLPGYLHMRDLVGERDNVV